MQIYLLWFRRCISNRGVYFVNLCYLLWLRHCISVRGVHCEYIIKKYSSIVILCIFWLTSGISVRVVYLKYIVKYCSGMVIYLPTLPYMLYVGSWCLFEIYIYCQVLQLFRNIFTLRYTMYFGSWCLFRS